MVSLVIVSHSAEIARGVKALADQMTGGGVAVIPAGGLDERTLGTNVETILNALEEARSPQGILVLMDLGSALLSAETALELLPPDEQDKVALCAAPLVEGALAAAVQASLGSDLEAVRQAALQALEPKAAQLGEPPPQAAAAPGEPPPIDAIEIELTLQNLHGLHARPAAQFVRCAAQYEAQVRVRKPGPDEKSASAASLNSLATLGARQGDRLIVSASGREAPEALAALRELVESGFGEAAEPEPEQAFSSEAALAGDLTGRISVIPAAPGFAFGPLARLHEPEVPVDPRPGREAAHELQRLATAVREVTQALQERQERLTARAGATAGAILEAQRLILNDPKLLEEARTLILREEMNASRAWEAALRPIAGAYQALADDYQRQRLQDVLDVGRQVARSLSGSPPVQEIRFDRPVILVAEQLTPGQTALLDAQQVLGIATVQGGPTAHSAILAQALGVPAVAGVPPELLELPEGTPIGLDGSLGGLWIEPDQAVREQIRLDRERWQAESARLEGLAKSRGRTRDGCEIAVAANAGGLAEAQAAARLGAQGIGLLRSEFLFLGRGEPPTEDEQVRLLQPIFECMGGHAVIARTLDAGGDKPLRFLEQPAEANPFLGVRGLRLALRQPEIFHIQLRAILRAGNGRQVGIMFPMVAALQELLQARRALEQAHAALAAQALPHAWPVEVGVMVEVPAAALLAETLAPHVDFFSLGTNDLTQYTLAAERGHPGLAVFQDGLHPAVLRLVERTARSAQAAGKWAGVCGELAGDPAAIPILVGLGITELSMNPQRILRAKGVLGQFSVEEARRAAEMALGMAEAHEVRAMAQEFLAKTQR